MSQQEVVTPSVCGICLEETPACRMYHLQYCRCSFCVQCLAKYFEYMVDNGNGNIYCPSFERCIKPKQLIANNDIQALLPDEYHQKYRVWLENRCNDGNQCSMCTKTLDECELSKDSNDSKTTASSPKRKEEFTHCPRCSQSFCRSCRTQQHFGHNCTELSDSTLVKLDIKKCPNCRYLIQREGGCAQISCRNCSHVFCWHCLKSLDNDFLLFHYDSGPCKNKLGHSRLTVFFNRVQTISICLGISILMILASPVILVALPCLLTTRCRKRSQSGQRV